MANTNRVYVSIKATGETAMVPNPGESLALEFWQAAVGGYVQAVRMTKDIVVLCNEDGNSLGLPRNKRVACFRGDLLLCKRKVTRSGREVFEGFRPSEATKLIETMDQAARERSLQ